MGVLTRTLVIGGEDDGDLPSLLEDVRAGRPAALNSLVARVQLRVRIWATRFASDEDAAEDIAQEVLIDLERRLGQFEGRSRFSTWLFTVTRNVALSQRRREQRRAALLQNHVGEPAASAPSEPNTDAKTLVSFALRYVDALPRKQRLIFELTDIRGMTPADVARELKMEQVTVRAHLFKARRAIRAQLIANHERMLTEYRS